MKQMMKKNNMNDNMKEYELSFLIYRYVYRFYHK